MLLRSESVASSFIEGLAVGMGRLLRQQLARELGFDASDSIADEIVSNIEAMSYVIDTFDTTQDLTPQHILDIHLLLAERVRPSIQPGRFRDKQNWIGRNSYNPCGADHVPPPPEYVVALMDDLCAFVNENALPPLVLAAIAHAQFETIHPFIDGNGRTGRALIYLILRRTATIDSITPPISLALARARWSVSEGVQCRLVA